MRLFVGVNVVEVMCRATCSTPFFVVGENVVEVMITSDYLQLRAFHAALSMACGMRD